MGMLPSWPHFPGAGHVTYRQVVPGEGERPGPAALPRAARERSSAAGSRCVTDSPATELPADGRPVVLAAGGFEYDAELRDTYLPLPLAAVGHPGNSGDAIRLAQQAGASLWHMSAFFGWFAFRHPDHVAAFPLDVHAPSFISVDGDGRRFADETGWEVHDKLRCLTTYLPRRRNRPRMPGLPRLRRARTAGRAAQRHRGDAQRVRVESRQRGRARGGLDWRPRRGGRPRPRARAHAARVRRRSGCARARSPEHSSRSSRRCTRSRSSPRWRRPRAALGATRRRAPCAPAMRAHTRPSFAVSGSIWGHLTEHGGGLTDAMVFGRIAGARAQAAPGPSARCAR